MLKFKVLKHKTQEGSYGVPTECEGNWELFDGAKPDLYGPESDMEGFRDYWSRVPNAAPLLEQLADYDYVDVFVAEPIEIEEMQSWKKENFDNVDMAGETIRDLERKNAKLEKLNKQMDDGIYKLSASSMRKDDKYARVVMYVEEARHLASISNPGALRVLDAAIAVINEPCSHRQTIEESYGTLCAACGEVIKIKLRDREENNGQVEKPTGEGV